MITELVAPFLLDQQPIEEGAPDVVSLGGNPFLSIPT
jgi:hypothetical protein